MPKTPVDEKNSSPTKGKGSARTAKKPKKRKGIPLDWLGEQGSVKSSPPDVQQQAQDIGDEDTASPDIPEEESLVEASEVVPGIPISDGSQSSPPDIQQQAQDIGDEHRVSPEIPGEGSIVEASKIVPDALPSGGSQSSPPDVQQQDQDVEDENTACPEPPGEESTVVASEVFSETSTSDGPPSNCATYAGSVSPPDGQYKDELFPELQLSTTNEQTDEEYIFQQYQEEQYANEWPSENIRPSAQNLRYGGGYPTQPAAQHRTTPLGSGRLQNTTKLGAFELRTSRTFQRNANASEFGRERHELGLWSTREWCAGSAQCSTDPDRRRGIKLCPESRRLSARSTSRLIVSLRCQ